MFVLTAEQAGVYVLLDEIGLGYAIEAQPSGAVTAPYELETSGGVNYRLLLADGGVLPAQAQPSGAVTAPYVLTTEREVNLQAIDQSGPYVPIFAV